MLKQTRTSARLGDAVLQTHAVMIPVRCHTIVRLSPHPGLTSLVVDHIPENLNGVIKVRDHLTSTPISSRVRFFVTLRDVSDVLL